MIHSIFVKKNTRIQIVTNCKQKKLSICIFLRISTVDIHINGVDVKLMFNDGYVIVFNE